MKLQIVHTNAVYQFVSPRVEVPTKAPPFSRALGALHGSHSASFLPLAPSAERQEAAVNRLRRKSASSFCRLPWPLGTLSPPTVVFHSAFNTVGVPSGTNSGFFWGF